MSNKMRENDINEVFYNDECELFIMFKITCLYSVEKYRPNK